MHSTAGLVTRYQNIDNAEENACRYVNLYGNVSQLGDFYVSCPFSDAAFEGSAYRLQYLVIDNENHTYNKKYVFRVPQHELIGEFSLSPFAHRSILPNTGRIFQKKVFKSTCSRPSYTWTCRIHRMWHCTCNHSHRDTTWCSIRFGWSAIKQDRRSARSFPLTEIMSTFASTFRCLMACIMWKLRHCTPIAASVDARIARHHIYT